jgi:hypothetical protein
MRTTAVVSQDCAGVVSARSSSGSGDSPLVHRNVLFPAWFTRDQVSRDSQVDVLEGGRIYEREGCECADIQLAQNSNTYDLYVHRAIRSAWRAAGLLGFRPAL